MLSKQLEVILNSAVIRANHFRHEYLTLEGMMLSLLEDQEVCDVLKACGLDIEHFEKDLQDFYQDESHFSVLDKEEVEELSKKQFVDEELRKLAQESGIYYQPEISLALQRVIQRAAIHVQSAGKKDIYGINILVAMFNEKQSYPLYLLEKSGINKIDILEKIAHGLDKPLTEKTAKNIEAGPSSEDGNKDSALESYCQDLTELARQKKIDPTIGREKEIERIVQILARRRKNNPLLVGDAGVGKTAIAEGLALNIIDGKVPEVLKGAKVYALDMALLLAGAKYRGDFEQRLKSVVNELKKESHAILFIDEIHTVMGAGSTSGGSLDASNLLKPALSSGQIRCLGSTTHDEFRKFIEKDSAFARRFQKVDVDEPSKEDTLKILAGLKEKFEEHHGVKYSTSVLRYAVDLAEKFISDRKNPDKSIDVIDEAGAMIQILPENKRHQNITKKDIELVVAMMAKVPKISVALDEREKLKNLRVQLKMLIFGQDHAIDTVCDTILMSRSGLGDNHKPIGAFLFTGPTGVGKTELAKQLSHQLGAHLQRFDMSEYMEKHSVAKLIGAPPGYVGHDNGGLLTDAVKKNPHCVLLLDEIEKAHPDLFNILLQIMDHGTLTDSQGRSTDFRNVVLIMTSNAGAKEFDTQTIGLSKVSDINSSKRDKVIKDFFTPEFRNRLSGIVHFNKLTSDQIEKVVTKFLAEVEAKLQEKNVELVVDQNVVKWLADVGFDPLMGARPLGRMVDEKIKKPLSHELLFGRLSRGGRVLARLNSEKSGIEFVY